MNEVEIRKQTALQVMDVSYLPVIPDEKLNTNNCHKLPLSQMSALGTAFKPVAEIAQSVAGKEGGSGFYYVNTHGKQMMKFKDGSGFLGSLANNEGTVGGGQATISQIPCDPTMLFMAAALANIEKKLDDIKELQEEMMDYLKAKEKAKLRGDVNTLTDIINNYKFNWDNEKYKTNKHILVQDIRKEAEQSIQLYRDQIQKRLSKRGFITVDQEVNAKLQKIASEFRDYQLALYLYSFSTFLEVMLLENFDTDYLKSVMTRIEEYEFQYRELYTDCYNQIEGMSKTSVQTSITKGLASISRTAGETIAKIPIVNKGSVDEVLIAAGDSLGEHIDKKTVKTMTGLIVMASKSTAPFLDNLQLIDKIYNEPIEVLFDNQNMYFIAG